MGDNPAHFKPGHEIGISGRWKPGQSGNPKGRPISKPYKEALEQQLAALALKHGIDPNKGYEVIAAAHVAKAMSGDMAAIKELADRIDGKVPNPVGGTDELPPITAFAWKPDPLVERKMHGGEGPIPENEPLDGLKTITETQKDDKDIDD